MHNKSQSINRYKMDNQNGSFILYLLVCLFLELFARTVEAGVASKQRFPSNMTTTLDGNSGSEHLKSALIKNSYVVPERE